jgi:putative membrane protein
MRTSTTLHMLLIAGLLSVTACNDAQNEKAENMADSAAAKVENVIDNAKDAMNGNADSNFVVDATRDNMAEIKSIQAGLDRGTNKELKMHAKMMMADHKKMGAEVTALSAKLGYPLPANDDGKGDDAVASIDKNNKGNDWDKAWVDHMVSAHEDAIRLFEKGQNNVKNDELKTMIANALPTLRSHLDMMKQMQDKLGK